MLSLQRQIAWYVRVQWTLAITIALLGGAFYVACYRPVTARQAALDMAISRNRDELATTRNETKVLPAVALEVEKLKTRLRQFKILPAQQELAEFIRDIANLGDQAALKKFEHQGGTPVRGTVLNELPIQLNFDGDFVNVFSFLRHTEELQRLTRVRAMNIKARPGDRTGQVKVELTMNIYFAAN